MTPLPLTAALSPLAEMTDHDLTRFAMREAAFNDMLANALRGGPAYDEAKARFDALAMENTK